MYEPANWSAVKSPQLNVCHAAQFGFKCTVCEKLLCIADSNQVVVQSDNSSSLYAGHAVPQHLGQVLDNKHNWHGPNTL